MSLLFLMICLFNIPKRDILVAETGLWISLTLQRQCFLWTCVNTGKAMLTWAGELGISVCHAEVAMRTYSRTGATGMVYARVQEDGSVKSSVDKFYSPEVLENLKAAMNANPGDLILILSGDDAMKVRKQLCELRLEMGARMGLRDKNKFSLLWIVDFPMFEWSEEEGRLMAMHHPFTHPKDEDIPLLDTDPAAVRADAYDMVCNGVEVGGGSIRIHDQALQAKMFEILGFTPEKAQQQFGFLMNAFKYGAPPHGGLAYGLDRWVSLFAGLDSIRDCIAFPKNNSGRDVMLDAPGFIDQAQLDELCLSLNLPQE